MKLSYFDNNKNGQTVIFVHGTGSASHVWEKQYKFLSNFDFRIIGVDLRGHGDSPNKGGLCFIEDHVNDLKETLDSIDLDLPAVIVGHSFGAVVGIKFTEKYPSLVDKLLLASFPPRVPRLMCLYYKWLLGKPVKFLKKQLSTISKFSILSRLKIAIQSDLSILRQIWRESLYWDFLSDAPKITCPVHLSVGRFDYIALKSLVKKVHRLLPNSSYKVFKWSSHTCMDDEPHEFNRWLLSAINQTPMAQAS
jgi:pimeloyl-ACP methyl ester carboxylesterase